MSSAGLKREVSELTAAKGCLETKMGELEDAIGERYLLVDFCVFLAFCCEVVALGCMHTQHPWLWTFPGLSKTLMFR